MDLRILSWFDSQRRATSSLIGVIHSDRRRNRAIVPPDSRSPLRYLLRLPSSTRGFDEQPDDIFEVASSRCASLRFQLACPPRQSNTGLIHVYSSENRLLPSTERCRPLAFTPNQLTWPQYNHHTNNIDLNLYSTCSFWENYPPEEPRRGRRVCLWAKY
jgi:hypothetical protein